MRNCCVARRNEHVCERVKYIALRAVQRTGYIRYLKNITLNTFYISVQWMATWQQRQGPTSAAEICTHREGDASTEQGTEAVHGCS